MRGRADVLLLFSTRISELASLLAADSSAAKSRTSDLPSNPHILTRHRSTAELRVVGIETSRTESLTEEPSAESNNLAMSRLRTRETIIGPCVGLVPSLNVCNRKKKEQLLHCCTQQFCCNSPRILDTHWVRTLGHLESTSLPARVAARSV